MKEIFMLCTKNVHFTFNEEIFKQIHGVAMESPLAPVLGDNFMVELENNIVPVLWEYLRFGKRYVINYILTILNNFDPNIKLTQEVKKDCKLPFLDAILIKKGNNIVTTVFSKETTNNIYLNWKCFVPTTWKRGTLNALVDCAYLIYSNIELRKKEIDHLKKVFHEKNDYPKWAINQILKEVEEKHKTSVNNVLSYQGQKDNFIKKRLKPLLPYNVKTDLSF